jgi:hypothetical protein
MHSLFVNFLMKSEKTLQMGVIRKALRVGKNI